MCVCVCVREREGGRDGEKWWEEAETYIVGSFIDLCFTKCYWVDQV